MNDVLAIYGISSLENIIYAEATPEGINMPVLNSEDMHQSFLMVDYPTAIRLLDEGRYDDEFPTGLQFVAGVLDGDLKRYYILSNAQKAIIYRWLVVFLFISEQQDNNGLAGITGDGGSLGRAVVYSGVHGDLYVTPLTERIFLANNVEGVAIQNHGVETGLDIAARMYEGMMEVSPEGCMQLSSVGREELARLYDSFIKTLKTDGLPATPVMH
jgi:hypothetical protein